MKFKNQKAINEYCENNGITANGILINEEYEEMQVINEENEQKLIYKLIPIEDVAYEKAKKELTITSQYHDWHATIADRVSEIAKKYEEYNEDENENQDLILILMREWNDLVDSYNKLIDDYNKYGDLTKIKKNKITKILIK